MNTDINLKNEFMWHQNQINIIPLDYVLRDNNINYDILFICFYSKLELLKVLFVAICVRPSI